MAFKVGMVSLGCPKNQVDGEIMLSMLKNAGYDLTPDENEADAILVNTCGFIEDAKQESIENILELSELKSQGKLKALVVTGCMAERYKEQVRAEMPEIDAVVGIGGNARIVEILDEVLLGKGVDVFSEKSALPMDGQRILTTPSYTAYLKIAEGCDNGCTYCAIPMIRGRFRSRQMDKIIAEAKQLSENGVRELVVVAQDTTRYGEDLYGRSNLPELLSELEKLPDIKWIRVLYTYPERITEALIDVIAKSEKIVHYLDMPIQHASGEVLKRMNRKGNRTTLTALINRLRLRMPDITLRTTLIAGFPGETHEQFEALAEFVKETEFDRLGCFVYSQEEGTRAAAFEDQIDEQVKHDRAGSIMCTQAVISEQKNKQRIGEVCEVLVEGYDGYIKCFYGRSAKEAPEIDGKVFFKSSRKISEGEFVDVLINDVIEYDLLGELVEAEVLSN